MPDFLLHQYRKSKKEDNVNKIKNLINGVGSRETTMKPKRN
jgi:hypothetical protein